MRGIGVGVRFSSSLTSPLPFNRMWGVALHPNRGRPVSLRQREEWRWKVIGTQIIIEILQSRPRQIHVRRMQHDEARSSLGAPTERRVGIPLYSGRAKDTYLE
jgi:hypothetical protein